VRQQKVYFISFFLAGAVCATVTSLMLILNLFRRGFPGFSVNRDDERFKRRRDLLVLRSLSRLRIHHGRFASQTLQ
jgi:hypothetical protein